MLDKRTRLAYFNGLVFPHLDYADAIWGDQPGLTSEMQQLQAFQNRFAKKIAGGKFSSAEALRGIVKMVSTLCEAISTSMSHSLKCNEGR